MTNITDQVIQQVTRTVNDRRRKSELEAELDRLQATEEAGQNDDRRWQIRDELYAKTQRMNADDARFPSLVGVSYRPVVPPPRIQSPQQPPVQIPNPVPPSPPPVQKPPRRLPFGWTGRRWFVVVIILAMIMFYFRHNIVEHGREGVEEFIDGAPVITMQDVNNTWEDITSENQDPIIVLAGKVKGSIDPDHPNAEAAKKEINTLQYKQSQGLAITEKDLARIEVQINGMNEEVLIEFSELYLLVTNNVHASSSGKGNTVPDVGILKHSSQCMSQPTQNCCETYYEVTREGTLLKGVHCTSSQ